MADNMPWQDSRGYFMLPQRREESAYYTYGTPASGRAQYAHPNMLSFLFKIEHLWGGVDNRRIGVGNVSLAGGAAFPPHRGHRNGLHVDLRPLRTDGNETRVSYREAAYDRAATARLVQLMWQTGMVSKVYFNDSKIGRVAPMDGHDDHLHVEVTA
jgi:penicillin-insensitive murein DD-endopeptidase